MIVACERDNWRQRWQNRLSHSRQLLLSLLAGSLLPLAFAPLNLWPLALLCPAVLALLTRHQSSRFSLLLGFVFGLGFFGVGASWVYVSIHQYGAASVPLAALLTVLFVTLLSAIFSLPFGLLGWLKNLSLVGHFCAFCALWVIGEWLRSWLFTGFPWLLIGYTQLSTPLSGWAPVAGIFAVSLLTVAFSCSLGLLLVTRGWNARLLTLLLLAAICGSGLYWQQQHWTQADGPVIEVALVQPNIAQQNKWKPEYLRPSLEHLQSLSLPAWEADWIIWPEAAIPMLYHNALPFLEQMNYRATATESAFITGILYDDRDAEGQPQIFNSLVGLGLASGNYHKTRLVPFGEYVPLENWLRGLIEFFNLPTSIITSGPQQQPGLQVGRYRLAAAICYEIVYPDLVARNSHNSAAIVTVSNDAWFGHSWGPLQHLQMAQMRALETGRYVIRATNNGISAIIQPDGSLMARSVQFESDMIAAEINPVSGDTPFMRHGSEPLLVALFALLTAIAGYSRFRRSPTSASMANP